MAIGPRYRTSAPNPGAPCTKEEFVKRTARIITVLAATAAALVAFNPAANAAATVVINGVAYQDGGGVSLGSLPITITTSEIGTALDTIDAVVKSCVPKSVSTTINDPEAHVYYGAFDSIYYWQDWAEASESGCPNNRVTMKAQLCDQALDGTTFPACGDEVTYTGTASASGTAELFVDYPNTTLLTGSPHALTMRVTATQTDGTTTTAWCRTRTWTYLATAAGPEYVGSTATNGCGS
jgi:hypothetical protein